MEEHVYQSVDLLSLEVTSDHLLLAVTLGDPSSILRLALEPLGNRSVIIWKLPPMGPPIASALLPAYCRVTSGQPAKKVWLPFSATRFSSATCSLMVSMPGFVLRYQSEKGRQRHPLTPEYGLLQGDDVQAQILAQCRTVVS